MAVIPGDIQGVPQYHIYRILFCVNEDLANIAWDFRKPALDRIAAQDANGTTLTKSVAKWGRKTATNANAGTIPVCVRRS